MFKFIEKVLDFVFIEERNKAKRELENERKLNEDVENQKEEIQVAADHALKMTAKWEKIHKKEAKKAQKSQLKNNAYEVILNYTF